MREYCTSVLASGKGVYCRLYYLLFICTIFNREQCRRKPNEGLRTTTIGPSIFWQPFLVVTLLINNRHTVTVSVVFCSCSFHRIRCHHFLYVLYSFIFFTLSRCFLSYTCSDTMPIVQVAFVNVNPLINELCMYVLCMYLHGPLT